MIKTVIRRSFLFGTPALALILATSSAWIYLNSKPIAGPKAWVIVLGDRVHDGEPSVYLQARLDKALDVLSVNTTAKVLISGHAASTKGNEVAAMRSYLQQHGIASGRIVDDNFGSTTYQTCSRAHRVFGIESATVVTQAFHLPRAIALCRGQGIAVEGAVADTNAGIYLQVRNWFRELVLSRPKALLESTTDPGPITLER